MSGMTQAMVRSIGTSPIGAKFVNTEVSPFLPLDALVTAPHGVEHIEVLPLTGSHQPNQQMVAEFTLDADILTKVNIRLYLRGVGSIAQNPPGAAFFTAGAATFIRYVDLIGLSCWDTIRIQFGTERLQTLRSEEIFAKIMTMVDDELRNSLLACLGQGTPVQRTGRATNDHTQMIMIPLLTLLQLSIGGDPSGNLGIRMLGERVKITVTYRSSDRWLEGDGTYATSNAPAAAIATTALATQLVDSASVYCEYQHLYDDEREKLEAIYKMPRRYVFSEQQYVSRSLIPAATLLNGGTVTVTMNELTQPVNSFFVFLRWEVDVDRVLNNPANGSFGMNLWNVGKFIFLCNNVKVI